MTGSRAVRLPATNRLQGKPTDVRTPGQSDSTPAFAGLDLLVSAVVLLDEGLCIRYCNPADTL